LDKGYDAAAVRAPLAEFGCPAPSPARGAEAREHKLEAGKRARRWVVERSHRWMNRFRRILVRWDKKPETYLACLHFVCALIAFRAAGLFG
jgi:putative transposase